MHSKRGKWSSVSGLEDSLSSSRRGGGGAGGGGRNFPSGARLRSLFRRERTGGGGRMKIFPSCPHRSLGVAWTRSDDGPSTLSTKRGSASRPTLRRCDRPRPTASFWSVGPTGVEPSSPLGEEGKQQHPHAQPKQATYAGLLGEQQAAPPPPPSCGFPLYEPFVCLCVFVRLFYVFKRGPPV